MKRIVAGLFVALVATAGCGSSPCDEFYGIYQSCGYGDPTAADIDKCNMGIANDKNCRNALLDLNYCAKHLPNQCTYDQDCSQYLDFLKSYCDI